MLYALTQTNTTGGLETVFDQDQDTFMGLQMNPIIILAISIALSLKSCFTLNHKVIKTEKTFVPGKAAIMINLWGLFSSLRRILSMVVFFIPSLGLFDILYHYRLEQLPFSIWQRYGKTQQDKLALYGLEETVLWGDIDRWDYSVDPEGIPPNYTHYTGVSLGTTFFLFFALTGTQLLVIFFVKIFTSPTFSKRDHYLNKFLHGLLSLNFAIPYEDWDQGRYTVNQYRERHRITNIEMAWTLSVNIVFSLAMLVPLWYTG